MNGRRKGAVDFLAMLRLEIAAADKTQKDLAIAANMTEPNLTRILHGQIPLTPDLKCRLLLALHRDVLVAAPDVVRAFVGGIEATDANPATELLADAA